MFGKLALRNVRRSARDYLVYVLTMTFVVSLMFAFNSIIFSKDLQKMYEMAAMMAAMIGIATFFIVLIVAWLINYMVRFMLEKRSREFGIYLLIGMNKKEVSGLYMKENLLLGVCSFVIGLGLGMLLQQVLLVVLYSVIQVELRPHLEFNGYCFLMTVCCFAGCYLLALFRCSRKFRKMNIHDLMRENQKNEELKERKNKAVITAVFHSVHLCVRCLDTERKYTVARRGSSISDGSVYYNVCVLYRAFRMDHLLCEEKRKCGLPGAEFVPAASVCI